MSESKSPDLLLKQAAEAATAMLPLLNEKRAKFLAQLQSVDAEISKLNLITQAVQIRADPAVADAQSASVFVRGHILNRIEKHICDVLRMRGGLLSGEQIRGSINENVTTGYGKSTISNALTVLKRKGIVVNDEGKWGLSREGAAP